MLGDHVLQFGVGKLPDIHGAHAVILGASRQPPLVFSQKMAAVTACDPSVVAFVG